MDHVGPYEVLSELGRGGMGVVYLALRPTDEHAVAVKLLAVDDERMAERLQREAERLSQLDHPNIVRVADVGQHDGQPYYAMTYCAGGTLSDVLARDGRLAPPQAAAALVAVARALEAVHSNNLVHRDVKPSNVLLSADGQPFLGDLGIAADTTRSRRTTTGAVLGTIGYTAPELMADGAVTPAADVFGLGVLGYQLLAGVQPFEGSHIAAVMDAVRTGRHRPLHEIAPDAPRRMCDLIEEAMSTDPVDRPLDLGVWSQEIARCTPPLPIEPAHVEEVAHPTLLGGRKAIARTDSGAVSTESIGQRRMSGGLMLRAGGAAAAVLALVAGVLVFKGDSGTRVATKPAASNSSGASGTAPSVDLPVRQTGDGVVVGERWTLDDDTIGSQVVVRNTSSEQVKYQLDVIVPKEIAESVDDVLWNTQYTSVVDPDPVVRYCLTLGPKQVRQIIWWVEDLKNVDVETLNTWASDYGDLLRATLGKSAGEPCPDTTVSDDLELIEQDELAAGGTEGGELVSFPDLLGSSGSGSGRRLTSGGGHGTDVIDRVGGTDVIDGVGGTDVIDGSGTDDPCLALGANCSIVPPDSCPSGDFSSDPYDGQCGDPGVGDPIDNCPLGDNTVSLFDGSCGSDLCDVDFSGDSYDGTCGTQPPDDCDPDYSGNAYDGTCGTQPPDDCDPDYSGNAYDGTCGTQPPDDCDPDYSGNAYDGICGTPSTPAPTYNGPDTSPQYLEGPFPAFTTLSRFSGTWDTVEVIGQSEGQWAEVVPASVQGGFGLQVDHSGPGLAFGQSYILFRFTIRVTDSATGRFAEGEILRRWTGYCYELCDATGHRYS